MDGQDEWRYFTDKDIEEQREWEDTCETWEDGFVKSRKRDVWVCHVKGSGLYACDIRIFDSEEAAEEYLEQLMRSKLRSIVSPVDRLNCIDKLPIYTCHKEGKET